MMTPAEREAVTRLDASFARVRAALDALTGETKKTVGAIDELSAWIETTRRERGL